MTIRSLKSLVCYFDRQTNGCTWNVLICDKACLIPWNLYAICDQNESEKDVPVQLNFIYIYVLDK